MADKITIKSGALGGRTAMPNLNTDELGYRTDEKALYIGTENGNVKLCDAEMEQRLKAYIDGLVQTINTRIDGLTPPTE